MNLIKLDNLQLHHGEQIIFDKLSLLIRKGDRLCVIGRNGVGKSTLLKTLEGGVEPDRGHIWRAPTCKIAGLAQDLPEYSDASVYDYVAAGLAEVGADLARFMALSQHSDPASLAEMGRVQQRIEAVDGWSSQNRIEQVLTRLELDGAARLRGLSGGWRRRVALARALVSQPDVLLLDEPTNHLDIVSIEWLEKQLQDFPGAVVFVTHDRAFLRAVANRIGELDRGNLTLWDGDYTSFLALREQKLADEEKRNSEFDKRLAQEETWIRQGIKARRTRNEGRVRALKQMRQERAARLERQGNARMTLAADSVSGKLVAEYCDVSFAWDTKPVVAHFSGTILRGDKIGLIGPNGVGKSTFLKLLMGDLQPTSGEIKRGSKLSIAYFDQLRDQLELDKSAMDNIAEGREFIEVDGRNQHLISYLQDFLFTGERARTPIRALSGGERNRVLLAKLFSKPANCLIMDEPTNDLDAETLDLLEDLLLAYTGTLILVSHDREFLDNVVTSTIGFEGHGVLKEYVGGYVDWIRQGGVWFKPQAQSVSAAVAVEIAAPAEVARDESRKSPLRKLSYKLQLELDGLPQKIENLEKALQQLQNEVSGPEFYQQSAAEIARKTALLSDQAAALQRVYERWEELENQRDA
jgi:ATP-binding cassette subfamily F protein uup